MKNQFNLNITTPCSENFDQFAPTKGGGFCGSCEKDVIDFTKMNSEEIIDFFKNKSSKNTCGRFNSNQLKTYNKPQKKNKRLSFLSGIGLACLSLFSMFTTQAQEIKKDIEPKENSPEITSSKFENSIIVKGNVTEGDIPLPGANIILEGTTTGIATDFDGNFEFPKKLKIGDVLIVNYIGMTSQKVVIENKNSASKIELKINMKADACIIMGKVAVKKIYRSKKN